MWLTLPLLVLGILAVPPLAATAEGLAAGDRAPGFTLQGSDGAAVSLEQFLGKRGLVLAWFPKAFTPG